jgi:hypothetical protein
VGPGGGPIASLNKPQTNKFIHSSMALQSFVGHWPLLQFRNLFYTDDRTRWTSDQPYTQNNRNTE